MLQLLDTVKYLQRKGYSGNLTPCFDHLCCEKVEVFPSEMYFDQVIRFENASDPGDQAILYAISVPSKKIKGLYVDSYGLYHDDLSPSFYKRLQFCRSINSQIDAAPLS